MENCHPDRVIAESRRQASEEHSQTGAVERNATISAWLKTAKRNEISEIWGDPQISSDDVLKWEIPSETSQNVSERVSKINETYCYYVGSRQFSFVVEEPRMKTTDDEREISRVIKLGSSTFKRRE